MAHPLLTGLLLQAGRESGGGVRRATPRAELLGEAARARGAVLAPQPSTSLDAAFSQRARVRDFELPKEALTLPEELLFALLRRAEGRFCLRGREGRLLAQGLSLFEPKLGEAHHQAVSHELLARIRAVDSMYRAVRAVPLARHLDQLATVHVHPRLGTVGQKAQRLVGLTKALASELSVEVQPELLARAATLCKVDLATPFAEHFPELLGTVASELARTEGEPEAIVAALASHRLPEGFGAPVASDALGSLLALSDRLDTLVLAFACELMPTPAADPLRLRERAHGLLQILIGRRWQIELGRLVALAVTSLGSHPTWLGPEDTALRVTGFLRHRLKGVLLQSFSEERVQPALAGPELCPFSVFARLVASQKV